MGTEGGLVRVLKLSIAFAIILYLASLVVFFLTQRSLLYYPSHSYTALSEAHASEAFREISVRTQDGIILKAWYAPATTKPLTIVFFHGNADSWLRLRRLLTPTLLPVMDSFSPSIGDIADCRERRQSPASMTTHVHIYGT